MDKTQPLKKRLIEIAKNDGAIPENIDINAFADELKEAMASTDGDLRDRLALGIFCNLLCSGRLSDEKCRSILLELASDKYLLRGLGLECDDSVFGRSFSTYPIDAILQYNRQVDRRILSDDDVKNVLNAALKYLKEEIDFRGFVDAKGWADSMGHIADFYDSLAEDPAMGHDQLLTMLDAIRDKICIDSRCHGADHSRFARAIASIMRRGIVTELEFTDWVASFVKYEKTGDYIKDARLKSNRSEFMLCMKYKLSSEFPNLGSHVSNAFFELIE